MGIWYQALKCDISPREADNRMGAGILSIRLGERAIGSNCYS